MSTVPTSPSQYRGAVYLPKISCMLIAPDILVPGAGARNQVNAMQKRCVAGGMTGSMRRFHRQEIPKRFHRHEQRQFTFKKRSDTTLKRKRKYGVADWDLVDPKANKGRHEPLKERITREISIRQVGTSTGTTVLGVMRFPEGFRYGSGRGVTSSDMAAEIRQLTPADVDTVKRWSSILYGGLLQEELKKRPRIRKQLGSVAQWSW